MIKAKHAQIEFTNYCNLACVECPHRMMKRKKEHMSREVQQRVLEVLKPIELETIITHKDGEPLLHPEFPMIFRRLCAVKPKTKIDIYTNAYFLTPKVFHELGSYTVGNKVWFLVTMHGHKYDGTPYDFRKPSENVLDALNIIKENGWNNIEFIVSAHKTDYVSQEHMKMFYDYWMSVKAHSKAIHNVHANTHINPWGQRIEMKEGMVHYEACPYSDSNHLFIGVTGNVIPCCMDLEEEIIFGNIMTDDLKKIEKRRREFYAVMVENKVREHELCVKCLS